MIFLDYAKTIIAERLQNRMSLDSVIGKIRSASAHGKIAFYPCGRYSKTILRKITEEYPELLPGIIGCFDKSSEANMEGFGVYNIYELDSHANNIALLVVASNTFYARQMEDIKELTNYTGPTLLTSRFEITLESDINTTLSEIEYVYNSLADHKSKITYLIYWLSRVLNDEELTYLFSFEGEELPVENGRMKYGDFFIAGLDDVECRKELSAEIYKMKHVMAKPGDVVFDIGGFKGDTAVFFAASVGPQGKVYSFEPVKSNFNILLRNIADNHLQHVVTSINKGCSNGSGSCKATSAKSGAPWSFIAHDEGSEDVELTTVDEFIGEHGIARVDFIKMDVEGMEYNVLQGARKTIQRFKPKLAIPLYHETSDLTTLPLFVQELGIYEMYVRCMVEGPFGINLFCKPKGSCSAKDGSGLAL